jgi:hypothetical protein
MFDATTDRGLGERPAIPDGLRTVTAARDGRECPVDLVGRDVVVFPVDRVVDGVSAGVAPVAVEPVLGVGGAGASEREQLRRHHHRHL